MKRIMTGIKKKRMINNTAGDINAYAPSLLRSLRTMEDGFEISTGEGGWLPPLSVESLGSICR
jgi:hypothetical protein